MIKILTIAVALMLTGCAIKSVYTIKKLTKTSCTAHCTNIGYKSMCIEYKIVCNDGEKNAR